MNIYLDSTEKLIYIELVSHSEIYFKVKWNFFWVHNVTQ